MEPHNHPHDDALTDGAIKFQIRKNDGTTVEFEADTLLLKLACEECEKECGIKPDAQGLMPVDAKFLKNLAVKLCDFGFPFCTPTIAYQVWIAIGDAMKALKKNTSETAK